MTREELYQDIESLTVGLDDTFKFHCTQCGKCCRNRDDILLSAYDIFKMSRYLNINPDEFFKKYCNWYIGDKSRIPIYRLNSVGTNKRCPLLRNNKCSVHTAKPAVCAMYPLGRYLPVNTETANHPTFEGQEVKYLLQPLDCGDESETHTVREWLKGFDIEAEDEAFMTWQRSILNIGEAIRKAEKTLGMMTMFHIWNAVRQFLYLDYDIADDFIPQLRANAGKCQRLIERMVALSKEETYG